MSYINLVIVTQIDDNVYYYTALRPSQMGSKIATDSNRCGPTGKAQAESNLWAFEK